MFCELLPANVKFVSLKPKEAKAPKKKKGKEICKEGKQDGSDKLKDMAQENRLATLDIFSGCGGLSVGLQQSGEPFIIYTHKV